MYEDSSDSEGFEGSSSSIQQDGGPSAGIPLHEAIKTGNIDAVKNMLDTDADSINLTDADGNSALHIAAMRFDNEKNHDEKDKLRKIIQILLDKGAERLRANNAGRIPFEIATMRELALSQAEIDDIKNNNKEFHDFLLVCKILIPAEVFGDKGASFPYYEFGSDEEKIDKIRSLVSETKNVGLLRDLLGNQFNYLPFIKANEKEHGPTLLHSAASNAAIPEEVIEMIIKQGYNVNAPIAYPESKVEFTAPSSFFSQPEGSQAKAQLPEDAGMTPLHVAAFNGNSDMMKVLINNGADTYATVNPSRWTSYSGWTPYLLVARFFSIKDIQNMLNNLKGNSFAAFCEESKIKILMDLCGAKDSSFDDQFGFNVIDRCVLFSTDPYNEINHFINILPLVVLAKMFKFEPYQQLNAGVFQSHENLLKIKNHYGQDIRPRRVSKTNQWSELIHNNANFPNDNERASLEEELQKLVNWYLSTLPVLKYFANAEVNEITQKHWEMFKEFIIKADSWSEKDSKHKELENLKKACIATKGFPKTVGMISAKHKAFIECMEQLVEITSGNLDIPYVNELIDFFGNSNLESAKAALAHYGDGKQEPKQAIAADGAPGSSSLGASSGFIHSDGE